ncbi:Hypothetical protein BQ3484_307 [Cedratvirus A11]|uniref:Uncharacterized protein n=1 Tax=Cedratvirus A11 TaxID=1903266 RepID=A0A1M7XUK6_9VIRU|nr:Hypothetical protein BQ3484_307 [Cedratvirus A11]SHO33375.1 Hypothetical protein BQ3484_307 [Cedratvirus A11]
MGSRLKISHKPDREWHETYFWLKRFLEKNDILPMDFCYAIDVPYTLEVSMYFTNDSLTFPPPADCPFRQILKDMQKGFCPFSVQTLIYRERFCNFYSLNHRILQREGILGMRCFFDEDSCPSIEIHLEQKRTGIHDLIKSLPGWPFTGPFETYYIIG